MYKKWLDNEEINIIKQNKQLNIGGELIRGNWNCNTENDITISELEL